MQKQGEQMECCECGATATERHHVVPKSLGGKWTVPLCSPCHAKAHGMNGDRSSHNELTTLGIYKLDPNLLGVFMWYSWDVLPAMVKDYARSYEQFSGIRLSLEQIKNRIKIIQRWIEAERWDLFSTLAEHHGKGFPALVSKTIAAHYVQRGLQWEG